MCNGISPLKYTWNWYWDFLLGREIKGYREKVGERFNSKLYMVLNIFIFITLIQFLKMSQNSKNPHPTSCLTVYRVFSDTASLRGGERVPKAELPRKCHMGLLKQWSWVTHTQLLCLTSSILGWHPFRSPGWNDFQRSWLLDCFKQASLDS